MTLSSLLVCRDEAAQVLTGVLGELNVRVELCEDAARAFLRLAQDHFDIIVIDCEKQEDVLPLLDESHSSRLKESTLTVAVVSGQESIREMFSLGVNFVLYKPVSYERAMSTLRAAQSVLQREKRRNIRVPVHAFANVDYAGVEQARATLMDVAEDGMSVNFGKKLPPTSKVYFQFQLPGQTASVRLSGQVVWQDWNGRAGIQFVDVPQTSRRILRNWLQTSQSEATQRSTENAGGGHATAPQAHGSPASGDGDKQEARGREGETAARLRSEPGNRRGQTRYACRLGAEVYQKGSAVRNYCHLSDLSPGGCYLEMPLAFSVGTAVEIIVRTHEMKLHLSGKVKSSHPGYGVGISFHLNTNEERHGVQQLIDYAAATAETS
jgi:CheY-like chemotaxis protein